MGTLHLMICLPCSGKIIYARQLFEKTNALLLTPDEWHLKLFGHTAGQKDHGKNHSAIEKIMWDVAEKVLQMGENVILDFGFWGRVERDDFRQRAKRLGVDFKLHYLDVPHTELYRRLEERNKILPEGAVFIPKEEMDKYIPLFQPPEADELT